MQQVQFFYLFSRLLRLVHHGNDELVSHYHLLCEYFQLYYASRDSVVEVRRHLLTQSYRYVDILLQITQIKQEKSKNTSTTEKENVDNKSQIEHIQCFFASFIFYNPRPFTRQSGIKYLVAIIGLVLTNLYVGVVQSKFITNKKTT